MVWKLSLREKSFNLLIFRLIFSNIYVHDDNISWLLKNSARYCIYYLIYILLPFKKFFLLLSLIWRDWWYFIHLKEKQLRHRNLTGFTTDSKCCILVSNPQLSRYNTYCVFYSMLPSSFSFYKTNKNCRTQGILIYMLEKL